MVTTSYSIQFLTPSSLSLHPLPVCMFSDTPFGVTVQLGSGKMHMFSIAPCSVMLDLPKSGNIEVIRGNGVGMRGMRDALCAKEAFRNGRNVYMSMLGMTLLR